RKFKEINEAHEVLGNPDNRKKYDEYGENWKHAEEFEKAKKSRGQQQYSQAGSGGQQFSEEDFSDFFNSMFGGGFSGSRSGGRRSAAFKGPDYQAELQLNLTDVYTSHKQTLTVNNSKIRLTIPAGVTNGQIIKIKGKGGPGANNG